MSSIAQKFERNLRTSQRYSRFGLEAFPFTTDIDTDVTVGRDKEFNRMGLLIADLLDGVVPSITILGYKGVGKTHFMNVLYNILCGIYKKKKIEYRPFLTSNNTDFLEKYQTINILIEDNQKILFLIDDAGTIWERNKDKLIDLFNNKNVKIISVWHHASWGLAKRNHEWPIPKTQTEVLDRLEEDDIFRILKFRIEKNRMKKTDSPFSTKAIEILSKKSRGVPYTALVLAAKCLLHAIENAYTRTVDDKIVSECLSEMGLEISGIDKEKIENLTSKQKKILKRMLELSTSDKRALSAIDITKESDIQRAGVARHLRILEKNERILESKKVGRKRIYKIKPKYIRICEDVILGGEIEYSV